MPKKNHRQTDGGEFRAAASMTVGEATPTNRERPNPERVAERAYERFRMRGGEHDAIRRLVRRRTRPDRSTGRVAG